MVDYTGYTKDQLIAILVQRDGTGDDLPVLEAKIARLTDLKNKMQRLRGDINTIDKIPEELKPAIVTLIDTRVEVVSVQIDKLTNILSSLKT